MQSEEKLLSIVRRHLKSVSVDSRLDMSSNLPMLGLDSMSAINLLLDLEQEFGVTFPDEALTASAFATPRDIAAFIPSIGL